MPFTLDLAFPAAVAELGRFADEFGMNPEEKKRFARLNASWLAGEKIDGLKFLHNSIVEVTLPGATIKTGWIVAASADGPEPIYTVEAQDGSGDIESPESALRSVEQ